MRDLPALKALPVWLAPSVRKDLQVKLVLLVPKALQGKPAPLVLKVLLALRDLSVSPDPWVRKGPSVKQDPLDPKAPLA